MTDLLINPYRSDVQFTTFPDLESRIRSYYDRVFDTVLDFEISPRFFIESGIKIGFRDIFYYIDILYSNNPDTVIDVGCGECLWKNWFPNIFGFDPNTNEFSTQDFVDYFDKDFSNGHREHWHNGLALNSLHFIDWKDVEDQIHMAMNIVKSRFLFTFNFSKLHNVPSIMHLDMIARFHQKIKNTGYKIVLFDAPLLRGIQSKKIENSAHINGNVRFILSKD